MTLATLVLDFEIENSNSPEWTRDVKEAKEILHNFCDSLKGHLGLSLITPMFSDPKLTYTQEV